MSLAPSIRRLPLPFRSSPAKPSLTTSLSCKSVKNLRSPSSYLPIRADLDQNMRNVDFVWDLQAMTVEPGGGERDVSRCINRDGAGTLTRSTCQGERDPTSIPRSQTQREMLYVIGLGLGDERDITLRGLEAVRKCVKIYIEAYTSLLSFGLSTDGLSTLEKLYGKPVIPADREMVEEKADDILFDARDSDVAFLVVGDPFGATTHTDLIVRAKKLGIQVSVVHNASVMNAIGICGLQLYRYGETVSIPFFTETWKPSSFYEKIQRNRKLGLHTLCLLDIRVKEPSLESLCRGKKMYEPPRYMTINIAIEQLLEVEQMLGESAYNEATACVGFARLGSEDQKIVAGSMKELQKLDFGAPLHSLVIVGKTHPVEDEMLEFYSLQQ